MNNIQATSEEDKREMRNYLPIINDLPPAVTPLPKPLDEEQAKNERIRRGFSEAPSIQSPLVADGLYVKGLDSASEEVTQILKDVVARIDSVQDEHLKPVGIVKLGLLRQIWLEVSLTDDIEINLVACCRFTIDSCPAGARMMDAAQGKLEDYFNEIGVSKAKVQTLHAGSPWRASDVQFPNIKSAVEKILCQV